MSNFQLRKWASNSPLLLKNIDQKEHRLAVKKLLLVFKSGDIQVVLLSSRTRIAPVKMQK